ncbi:hypothetical protein R1sor_024699 [Riccia sorocarpa]|uniref:Uncharacterized protein n=1 Tax=Riccia sorocarpa TaxID=122646 RepID=A0ABD3GS08_9MARC
MDRLWQQMLGRLAIEVEYLDCGEADEVIEQIDEVGNTVTPGTREEWSEHDGEEIEILQGVLNDLVAIMIWPRVLQQVRHMGQLRRVSRGWLAFVTETIE